MKRECTLLKLKEIAKRKVIEYTTHICPMHGTHSIKNYKIVGKPPTMGLVLTAPIEN